MGSSVQNLIRHQCRREGREASKNYRVPVPDYVADVFVLTGSIVICPFYKLTLSDQAKVSLIADSQSRRLNEKVFRRSALAVVRVPALHRGPHPISATLHVTFPSPRFFYTFVYNFNLLFSCNAAHCYTFSILLKFLGTKAPCTLG